ncbi:hypothetical protein PDE01_35730 [Paracoccus denitrificans]|nr:hypothetical protein PDE01_35730 [Paracoccus denitrificans]
MTAWLLTILGAIAAAAAAFLRGRSRGRADAQAREDAAYRETRERIDHAGNDVDSASDADVDRRLRDHAKR